MKLSRIDFVPLLAIMAGGVLGASLSFGLLGSRSDVPAPERVVTPPVTPELEMPKRIGIDGMVVLTGARMKGNGMVLMGDRIEVHGDGDRMVLTGGRIEVDGMILTGDRIEVENLQEERWVVTSRPPVFWLPHIRQESIQARPVPPQEGAMTCFFNGAVYRFRSVNGDPEWVELSSDGRQIASSGPSPSPPPVGYEEALVCIDGLEEEAATQYLLQLASVGPRIVDNFVAEDIENFDVLLSAAAVRRFGEGASNGAIVLTLKEDPRRRP